MKVNIKNDVTIGQLYELKRMLHPSIDLLLIESDASFLASLHVIGYTFNKNKELIEFDAGKLISNTKSKINDVTSKLGNSKTATMAKKYFSIGLKALRLLIKVGAGLAAITAVAALILRGVNHVRGKEVELPVLTRVNKIFTDVIDRVINNNKVKASTMEKSSDKEEPVTEVKASVVEKDINDLKVAKKQLEYENSWILTKESINGYEERLKNDNLTKSQKDNLRMEKEKSEKYLKEIEEKMKK